MLSYIDVTETAVHQFAVDASDLGWAPGASLETIPTVMGNGRPFLRTGQDTRATYYRQELGALQLTVFND